LERAAVYVAEARRILLSRRRYALNQNAQLEALADVCHGLVTSLAQLEFDMASGEAAKRAA
jgi:hypothetical protein